MNFLFSKFQTNIHVILNKSRGRNSKKNKKKEIDNNYIKKIKQPQCVFDKRIGIIIKYENSFKKKQNILFSYNLKVN